MEFEKVLRLDGQRAPDSVVKEGWNEDIEFVGEVASSSVTAMHYQESSNYFAPTLAETTKNLDVGG